MNNRKLWNIKSTDSFLYLAALNDINPYLWFLQVFMIMILYWNYLLTDFQYEYKDLFKSKC